METARLNYYKTNNPLHKSITLSNATKKKSIRFANNLGKPLKTVRYIEPKVESKKKGFFSSFFSRFSKKSPKDNRYFGNSSRKSLDNNTYKKELIERRLRMTKKQRENENKEEENVNANLRRTAPNAKTVQKYRNKILKGLTKKKNGGNSPNIHRHNPLRVLPNKKNKELTIEEIDKILGIPEEPPINPVYHKKSPHKK